MAAALWVIAMTVQLYPHFGDRLQIHGRLIALPAYIEASCGQGISPAAAGCLAEAATTSRRLVLQEQAKSLLLIEAPLFAYLTIAAARLTVKRPG